MTSRSVLILGVGSSFGADRIGWEAVAALQQNGVQQRFPALDVQYAQSDRPGSGLLALLQDHAGAIIVDAMQASLPAGSVRRFTPEQLTADTGLLSSHGFGVAEALALGRQLGQLPQQLVICGIEIGTDTAATVPGAHSLRELEQIVTRELEKWADEAMTCDCDCG